MSFPDLHTLIGSRINVVELQLSLMIHFFVASVYVSMYLVGRSGGR